MIRAHHVKAHRSISGWEAVLSERLESRLTCMRSDTVELSVATKTRVYLWGNVDYYGVRYGKSCIL